MTDHRSKDLFMDLLVDLFRQLLGISIHRHYNQIPFSITCCVAVSKSNYTYLVLKDCGQLTQSKDITCSITRSIVIKQVDCSRMQHKRRTSAKLMQCAVTWCNIYEC